MKVLDIVYSEDIRENRVASEIYERLTSKGFLPKSVIIRYDVEHRQFKAFYFFGNTVAPRGSDLEEILNHRTLIELEFRNSENVETGVRT